MDVSLRCVFVLQDRCQGNNLHPRSDVYLGADVLLKIWRGAKTPIHAGLLTLQINSPHGPVFLINIQGGMHKMTLFLSVRPCVHVWNTCVG